MDYQPLTREITAVGYVEFDERGQPQYLLGISEDITDQKRTKHAEQRRALMLELQQFALCELAKHEAIYMGNLDKACEVLTDRECTHVRIHQRLADQGRSSKSSLPSRARR